MSRNDEKAKQGTQIRQELCQAAATHTLTYGQLSQAVRFVYDDGADYNHSVGASWIWNRPADFAKAVGERAEEFFREHQDVINFQTTPITHPDLFKLVAPERRLPLLRKIVLAHCHNYYRWVAVAINAGVASRDVAQLIREHLENDPPMHWHVEKFVSDGVNQFPATHDLNRERAMRNWEEFNQSHPGPWSVFKNCELQDLLFSCCQYAGKEIIKARCAINYRIGGTMTEVLLLEAAKNLDDLVHLEQHHLRGLPTAVRWQLAKRINPKTYQGDLASLFITSVVLEFIGASKVEPHGTRREEFVALLNKVPGAPALYAAAHSSGHEVPGWMEAILCDRLTRDGYIKGTVEEVFRFDKKLRQRVLQRQLVHGDRVYVQNRRQHHSFGAGDEVIIYVDSASFIARNEGRQIFVVDFLSAKKLLS